MIVTCDSSVVKAYVFTADAAGATSENYWDVFFTNKEKIITSSEYTCGDKLRIQSNNAGAIIVI